MSEAKNFIDISHFQKLELLGQGAFAKVYKVIDLETNKKYAAKITNDEVDIRQHSEENHQLFREVNLLASLCHPAIIKFYGFNPISFDNLPCPILVTEIAENGSLRRIINLENQGLSLDGWDSTKKLMNIYGIASSMMYLNKYKIIHRDLKPENILIDKHLCPRIADFGLSKMSSAYEKNGKSVKNQNFLTYQSQASLKGTPIYLAPECIDDQIYSEKSDVYSFAMIVYEIMTGNQPFSNTKSQFHLFTQVTQGARPEFLFQIPEAYQQLIEHCWAQDPNDRPAFEEVVTELKENEEFITETVDEEEFYQYVDDIDNGKTSFQEKLIVVDIANDLKINHLYVTTTVHDQIIVDLSELIEEVRHLYQPLRSPQYIGDILNLIQSVLKFTDSGKALPAQLLNLKQENMGTFFKLPNEIFLKMEAKLLELTEIMDHAGEEGVVPLTENMINQVFCSLVRRLLFIASENEIMAVITEEAGFYPFVVIHDELKRLMYQLFLRIYFSPNRSYLLHLYVYIALAFTIDMDYMGRDPKSLIFFNAKYPLKVPKDNLMGNQLKLRLINVATGTNQSNIRPFWNKMKNINRIFN